VFDLKRQNVATTDPVVTTLQNQTGEVTSRGIELEAVANATRELKLIGSFTGADPNERHLELDGSPHVPFAVAYAHDAVELTLIKRFCATLRESNDVSARPSIIRAGEHAVVDRELGDAKLESRRRSPSAGRDRDRPTVLGDPVEHRRRSADCRETRRRLLELRAQPVDEPRPRARNLIRRRLTSSMRGAEKAKDLAVRHMRGTRPVNRTLIDAKRLGDRRAIAIVIHLICVSQCPINVEDRQSVHAVTPPMREGEETVTAEPSATNAESGARVSTAPNSSPKTSPGIPSMVAVVACQTLHDG